MLTPLEMSKAALPLILFSICLRAVCIRRLPKRAFRALWGAAALRLLCPLALPARFSAASLFMGLWDALRAGGAATVETAAEALPQGVALAATPLPQATPFAQAAARSAITAEPAAFPVWGLVWLSGCLVVAGYFLLTYLRSKRRFASSLPVYSGVVDAWLCVHPLRRRVTVRQSDQVAGPLTYGILRPVILLPPSALSLPRPRLEAVLTHEYMHIRRFDAVYKLLLALSLCLHWFNPLAYALFALASRDMELSCDEAVLGALGHTQRALYAHTLLDMEEARGKASPLLSSFSHYAIEERITIMMHANKMTRLGTAIALTFLCMITLMLSTSYAAPGVSVSVTAEAAEGAALSSPDDLYSPEELKGWIAEQRRALDALARDGATGWSPAEGVFTWTPERVDDALAPYEDLWEAVKDSPETRVSPAHFAQVPGTDGVIWMETSDIDYETVAAADGQISTMVATVKSGSSDASPRAITITMPAVEANAYAVVSEAVWDGEAVAVEDNGSQGLQADDMETEGYSATIQIGDRITAHIGPYETEAALSGAIEAFLEAQTGAGYLTQAEAHAILQEF